MALTDRHGVEDPAEDADYWLNVAGGGVHLDLDLEEQSQDSSLATTPEDG